MAGHYTEEQSREKMAQGNSEKKIPRNLTGYPVPCGVKMPSHKRPKQMESENESL